MFSILSIARLNTQKELLVISAREEIPRRIFSRGKDKREGEAGR
jgi:hypothetical protein